MAEYGDSPRRVAEATSPEMLESPKRAVSNISTSTSSFEAGIQHDPNLNRLAVNMFSKTETYLQGELEAVTGEYRLLAEMNRKTYDKYAEMRAVGQETAAAMQHLSTRYADLEPYLRQLEAVDLSLSKLEQAASKLDAYSKQLENRCRALSSR